MSLPERDVLNRTKKELLDQLVVLMGGRIAGRCSPVTCRPARVWISRWPVRSRAKWFAPTA